MVMALQQRKEPTLGGRTGSIEKGYTKIYRETPPPKKKTHHPTLAQDRSGDQQKKALPPYL